MDNSLIAELQNKIRDLQIEVSSLHSLYEESKRERSGMYNDFINRQSLLEKTLLDSETENAALRKELDVFLKALRAKNLDDVTILGSNRTIGQIYTQFQTLGKLSQAIYQVLEVIDDSTAYNETEHYVKIISAYNEVQKVLKGQ